MLACWALAKSATKQLLLESSIRNSTLTRAVWLIARFCFFSSIILQYRFSINESMIGGEGISHVDHNL